MIDNLELLSAKNDFFSQKDLITFSTFLILILKYVLFSFLIFNEETTEIPDLFFFENDVFIRFQQLLPFNFVFLYGLIPIMLKTRKFNNMKLNEVREKKNEFNQFFTENFAYSLGK